MPIIQPSSSYSPFAFPLALPLRRLLISLSIVEEDMNWVQRKIHLYNVTFGLYMLDCWERCTFNILVFVLMCFVLRYITRFFKSYVW